MARYTDYLEEARESDIKTEVCGISASPLVEPRPERPDPMYPPPDFPPVREEEIEFPALPENTEPTELLGLIEPPPFDIPSFPETLPGEAPAVVWEDLPRLPSDPRPRKRSYWLLDLLLFAILCVAAFPPRAAETRGDFWFDEADYAIAATYGIEANRWDRPVDPAQPERLIRLRHYHPPLVAQVMSVAQRFGTDERTLRIPFVLAGCLTVGLVYLCGLVLFRGRANEFPEREKPLRAAAAACAAILIFTPAHIRASSHAIPWAWITLWLVALLWVFLKYAETRRSGWLTASGAVLGALFVTSEYLFPALVGVAPALLLLWFTRPRTEYAQGMLVPLLWGGALFVLIALLFWPVGLGDGAIKMLRHYVEMADTSAFPVVIDGQKYERAPKWAYLYWFWKDYLPYFLLYGAGVLAVGVMLFRGRLSVPVGLTVIFTGLILGVAHRAHIIGPEYLTHALPFLTLLGCLPLAALARAQPIPSVAALAACCWIVASAPEGEPLNGMEPRSQVPRWPAAARFLAERWKPGDKMLASQYAVAARWYGLNVGRLPAEYDDIGILPAQDARDEMVRDLLQGRYRWIAVGSTFADWTDVDNRVRLAMKNWKVVWRSDEAGTGASRLLIYERPPGISPRNPNRVPGLVLTSNP